MTPAQLTLACGAPAKWIRNARFLLGRAPLDGPREARWLGIVHQLHSSLGCALVVAARVADAVIAAPAAQRELVVSLEPSRTTMLVVDLWRDQSVYLARLSRALVRPPIERRGRPRSVSRPRGSARTRAVAYGVDVDRLRAGKSRSPDERLTRLDESVAFLAAARAGRRSPRGRVQR